MVWPAQGLQPGGSPQAPRKDQYPQRRHMDQVSAVVDVEQVDVARQQPYCVDAGLVKMAPPIPRQTSRDAGERGCGECNEKSEANEIGGQSKAIQMLVESKHEVGDESQMPSHSGGEGQPKGSAVAEQPVTQARGPE